MLKKIDKNILEETITYTRQIAKEDLLLQKRHLENVIANSQKELNEVNNKLALLEN